MNCLLEGRDVFAVMPTGFDKSFIFQLFSAAIEQKISEGLHPNSVILVICPLISLIKDQIKEGQFCGRTEDKHVRTNSGINKCNTNVLAHRGQNFSMAAIAI